MERLEGKVALISGAARGQGAAEASGSGTNRPDSDSGNSEPESRGDELAVLKEQLQNMQSQLNALAQKKT